MNEEKIAGIMRDFIKSLEAADVEKSVIFPFPSSHRRLSRVRQVA